MFTTNSMKPKQTNVLEHKIITCDALPQFRKPYRIPHAYENEVNKQINEKENSNHLYIKKSKIFRKLSSAYVERLRLKT